MERDVIRPTSIPPIKDLLTAVQDDDDMAEFVFDYAFHALNGGKAPQASAYNLTPTMAQKLRDRVLAAAPMAKYARNLSSGTSV